MTSVIVKRPPRRPAPRMPSGEMLLAPPPEIPNPTGKTWTRMLMILPMAAGAAAMGLMMGVQRGGPLTYVAGGMYGVSILGMIAMMMTNQGGPGKKEMIESRRQYMRTLAQLRAQIRATIRKQREAIDYRHPDPAALWSTVGGARLWERRRADADFGVVRIGVGAQEVATRLIPPQTRPVDELEPLCAMALRTFVATYSVVPDLSVAIALRDFSHVYVRGADAQTGDLVRAVLAQMATFHAPDDLLIGVCATDARRQPWEWAKWLPHAQHPSKFDAVGPMRLFAASVSSLEAILDDVLANRPRFDPGAGQVTGGPHVVVVVDGGSTAGSDHLMTDGGVAGVTILDLSTPPPTNAGRHRGGARRRAGRHGLRCHGGRHDEVGKSDGLSPAEAEVLARELAPLRLSATSFADQPSAVVTDFGLAELLELGSPHDFDLAADLGQPAQPRPAAGADRRRPATAARSSWTSRSRRRTAWARTACSSARPARARASCCAPWCWPSRSPTLPRSSTSCWSTSRAARPSPRWTGCRTPVR